MTRQAGRETILQGRYGVDAFALMGYSRLQRRGGRRALWTRGIVFVDPAASLVPTAVRGCRRPTPRGARGR